MKLEGKMCLRTCTTASSSTPSPGVTGATSLWKRKTCGGGGGVSRRRVWWGRYQHMGGRRRDARRMSAVGGAVGEGAPPHGGSRPLSARGRSSEEGPESLCATEELSARELYIYLLLGHDLAVHRVPPRVLGDELGRHRRARHLG